MKKNCLAIMCFSLFFLSACQKDIPEPEVKLSVIPMSTVQTAHDLPALGGQDQDNNSFKVQHHVKGNRIFVECIVPDVSFRDDSKNKGKLILYVDGEKKEEITTAAFIIQGLASGTHKIRLEVIKPSNKNYSLNKEFTVTIP